MGTDPVDHLRGVGRRVHPGIRISCTGLSFIDGCEAVRAGAKNPPDPAVVRERRRFQTRCTM